jgi:hypothetical protein
LTVSRMAMPDYRGMAAVVLSEAADACVRCHTTDRTSIVEIRPHRVWCCTGCYASVLVGCVYYGPVPV